MPEELDITVEEIVGVAKAAIRGDSLKFHAPAIRQYMDEALTRFNTLDQALKAANAAHDGAPDADPVLPEDRKVVDSAERYVEAENRMLRALMQLASECSGNGNSGGLKL